MKTKKIQENTNNLDGNKQQIKLNSSIRKIRLCETIDKDTGKVDTKIQV